MAFDPSCAGRTYPPSAPYEVGREKIREFATAIGDHSPACRDPAAARRLGHPDVIAPPTFPAVLTFAAGRVAIQDPEVGLDYSRVVHGEQRFVASRPVHAGDVLVGVTSIETARQVAGNDLLTTRCDVSTVDGEHVVTAYSTLVARAIAGS
ncbi:MAG: hypothetical protein DLM56_01300 [Pseudonocardiales bacterium]|nr:MAG: hypothetical protein DLM56_01300 [Pseudonocardiales bacterium]